LVADDRSDGKSSRSPPVGLLAAVLPVNFRLDPIGEPFLGLVKTISAERIALLHTRAIACGSVVIEVGTYPMDRIQLLCQVTTSQPSGRFYEIETVLVKRIAD
jgi:hypothetical protein